MGMKQGMKKRLMESVGDGDFQTIEHKFIDAYDVLVQVADHIGIPVEDLEDDIFAGAVSDKAFMPVKEFAGLVEGAVKSVYSDTVNHHLVDDILNELRKSVLEYGPAWVYVGH